MPVQRLGVANPATNVDTALVTFSARHLVSVVVSNKATVATPVPKVTIWVIPANAVVATQYAYICYNLSLSLGQSFETFRFGVNAGDVLMVRASTSNISFSCTGIPQEDDALPENIAQTFTNKVIRGVDNTVYIDKGATAERRGNAEVGYVRYNTDYNYIEVLTENGWEGVGPNVYDAVGSTTDSTSYVALYEDPTGSTGPKTNPDITFNASTGTLIVESVISETVAAPAAPGSAMVISAPTDITLAAGEDVVLSSPMRLVSKTVAQLADIAATTGSMVYCTNESGGAVPVFYDGSNWRRVTDRQIAS